MASNRNRLSGNEKLKNKRQRKEKEPVAISSSDDSNSESDQQVLRKFKQIVNRISKHKTPIAKPPNLKWYDLPKLLALEDKVYASYRSAMREFVAERWESNTPEYRKLSATKIRSLVKKYKANNPDFPNCIGDWAIKMMMQRSINQQRKVERDTTKGSVSKEKFNTRNEDISQDELEYQERVLALKEREIALREREANIRIMELANLGKERKLKLDDN